MPSRLDRGISFLMSSLSLGSRAFPMSGVAMGENPFIGMENTMVEVFLHLSKFQRASCITLETLISCLVVGPCQEIPSWVPTKVLGQNSKVGTQWPEQNCPYYWHWISSTWRSLQTTQCCIIKTGQPLVPTKLPSNIRLKGRLEKTLPTTRWPSTCGVHRTN